MFFNKVNIPCKYLNFEIHTHECHSGGRVSQFLVLGPTFYLMKLRKKKKKERN